MPFAAEVVQRKQRGMTVPIEIMRNNSVTVVQILGGDNVAANTSAAAQGSTPVQQEALAAEAALLGLGLRDVSPNTVSVTRVAVASPAAVAGIVPGDVIGTVDQSQVSTVAQFVSLIGVRQMGEQLNLVVLRDGKPFPTTLLMTPRLQDVSQASVAVATTVIHQEIKALEERLQSLANEVQRLEVQGPSSTARK
jgi:S1-C subfamily serine protease